MPLAVPPVLSLYRASQTAYDPPSDPPIRPLPVPLSIEQIVRESARAYRLSEEHLLALAVCESSMRPEAVGDGGLSVGLFQFQEATWRRWGEGNRTDAAASARAAARKASVEGTYRGGWSICSEKLGLP